MSFFTINNSKGVGSIPFYTASVGTPTSFDPAKINYYIHDIAKIDTTELVQKDAINNYLNSGPADYAGYYGNKEAGKLYFKNVISDYSVVFPAFIDSYNESFKPNFASEQFYGRTDATQKFSNTARTLSLGFKVLAYDEEHARKNLHALCALVQFMYPSYDGSNSGFSCTPLLIRETPLLRVRFSNMIQRSGRGDMSSKDYSFAKDGLLTVPTDFSFAPNFEAGFFFSIGNTTEYIYPKEIKVSMNFNVLHEETLGWIKTDKYHWVGKLDSSGKLVSKNVDFPWGNDTIGADVVQGKSASDVTSKVGSSPPESE